MSKFEPNKYHQLATGRTLKYGRNLLFLNCSIVFLWMLNIPIHKTPVIGLTAAEGNQLIAWTGVLIIQIYYITQFSCNYWFDFTHAKVLKNEMEKLTKAAMRDKKNADVSTVIDVYEQNRGLFKNAKNRFHWLDALPPFITSFGAIIIVAVSICNAL